jgi:hypothetical protein
MWFKVDDQFHSHPKILKAGNTAIGLWIRLGSWCAAHLTDGKVPKQVLELFAGSEHEVDALVDAGLLRLEADGGAVFHDFLDYQPSRKARKRLGKVRAEAGSKGGSKTAAKQKQNGGKAPSKGTGRDGTGSRKKMPHDWAPDQGSVDLANERGLNVLHEAQDFRDWTTSKGTRFVDWQAAFRNHLRRRGTDPAGQAPPDPPPDTSIRSALPPRKAAP